ncbi:MAG: ferredoxin [Patescibacteria group bacterium]
MKISIEEEKCIGCGVCQSLFQECFRLDGDMAKVVKEECQECDLEEVVNSCPTGAINLDNN